MQLHRSPALETVVASVKAWPGVTVVPHRFGGAAFRLGAIELGHVHADGTLDLQFPVPLRNRLIDEGWANIHHILPASGWVTFFIAEPCDVAQAVRLLRIAYLRRRLGAHTHDREAVLEVSRLDASPELLATLLGKPTITSSATVH